MAEQWIAVIGYEGLYEVSDQGRVKSKSRVTIGESGKKQTIKEKILSPHKNVIKLKSGKKYVRHYVSLRKEGKTNRVLVHRLVLSAFVGSCNDRTECCHNNGDSSDNRLTNLRWDTKSNNMLDRALHGTSNRGEQQGSAKLTEKDVERIRELRMQGMSGPKLAKMFNIIKQHVYDVCSGRRWAHIK